MGICDSKTKKEIKPIENQKMNNCEEENSNNKETHPTSKNEKSSIEEKENNKCPELAKYENSMYISGKKSEFSHLNNKTASIFSSGQTEEEVIIRGEINKNCKNKEEDFDNNSFKKLVKNNGGIIIKKDDKNSVISSIHGTSVNRLGLCKEKLSEIKSIHTTPVFQKNGKKCSNNLVKNNMSENNKTMINQRIKRFLNNNNNNNNNLLRGSVRINVSMSDNCPMLSIPKTDEPLPDIEELSTESPILIGNHSLISE